MDEKVYRVAKLLINNRRKDTDFWYWLKPDLMPSRKDANKFFLGSILNYQMRAEVVWENARRLAEGIFNDPEYLWHSITSVTLADWMSKRKEYSLHRYPKGHERVWTIGIRIVHQYIGDARNIWKNQSIEATLYRLIDLGVGDEITRMIVGALIDTKQLTGKSDVKVDNHIRRVLGRIFFGREFDEHERDTVIELTRKMNPDNPWLLDRPLFLLGKQLCTANNPKCLDCYIREECSYCEQ